MEWVFTDSKPFKQQLKNLYKCNEFGVWRLQTEHSMYQNTIKKRQERKNQRPIWQLRISYTHRNGFDLRWYCACIGVGRKYQIIQHTCTLRDFQVCFCFFPNIFLFVSFICNRFNFVHWSFATETINCTGYPFELAKKKQFEKDKNIKPSLIKKRIHTKKLYVMCAASKTSEYISNWKEIRNYYCYYYWFFSCVSFVNMQFMCGWRQ